MATAVNFIGVQDAQYAGEYSTRPPVIADVYDSMADNDDTVVTLPDEAAGSSAIPPRNVQVYIHSGGDITSSAAATRAITDGDTVEIFVDVEGNGRYTKFTHVFTGVTAAAATPTQIAASINGDTQKVEPTLGVDGSNGYQLKQLVKAVAGLTANAVTLFPIRPRSKAYVGGGVAAGVLGYSGVADYSKRTYTEQVKALTGGTGWVNTYNANTRALTVKNETGGAVNRVHIVVDP